MSYDSRPQTATLVPPTGFDIYIVVPVVPMGKQRARTYYSIKDGKYITRTPSKTKKQEIDIKYFALNQMGKQKLKPTKEAVVVEIQIFKEPPESWSKKKKLQAVNGEIFNTSKPDMDNVEKLILDAFNKIVWKDDCQVIAKTTTKVYSRESHISVRVREATR